MRCYVNVYGPVLSLQVGIRARFPGDFPKSLLKKEWVYNEGLEAPRTPLSPQWLARNVSGRSLVLVKAKRLNYTWEGTAGPEVKAGL